MPSPATNLIKVLIAIPSVLSASLLSGCIGKISANVPLLVGSGTSASMTTQSADPVIAAAGDIACDPARETTDKADGIGATCQMGATANLLVGTNLVAVLPLGDTQYESGTLANFQKSYAPTWGKVKAITRPVVGNHEYKTPGAAGYFGYFGTGAGDPQKGYYSYDIGNWHLIALNANCSEVGGCQTGSRLIWPPTLQNVPLPTGTSRDSLLPSTAMIRPTTLFGETYTLPGQKLSLMVMTMTMNGLVPKPLQPRQTQSMESASLWLARVAKISIRL